MALLYKLKLESVLPLYRIVADKNDVFDELGDCASVGPNGIEYKMILRELDGVYNSRPTSPSANGIPTAKRETQQSASTPSPAKKQKTVRVRNAVTAAVCSRIRQQMSAYATRHGVTTGDVFKIKYDDLHLDAY